VPKQAAPKQERLKPQPSSALKKQEKPQTSSALKKQEKPQTSSSLKKQEKSQSSFAHRHVPAKISDFSSFMQRKLRRLAHRREKLVGRIQFDKAAVKTALEALLAYHQLHKKGNDLFDVEDDFVYLEIVLNELPEKHSIRPVAM